MEQGSLFETNHAIGFALIVNQQGQLDSGLFFERAGIMHIAQAHHRQLRSFRFDFLFVLAQLRNMLTAENSTIMAKKDHDRRPISPQGAQPHRIAFAIGQSKARKLAAVVVGHGQTFSRRNARLSTHFHETFIMVRSLFRWECKMPAHQSSRYHISRNWLSAIAVVCCGFFLPVSVSASPILDLAASYEGKTMMLRHSYCGKILMFDTQGNPTSGQQPGAWTIC